MDDIRFKKDDKVYHKRLKWFGVFIKYSKLSDDECFVIFTDEDGNEDTRCVSVSQLLPVGDANKIS